MPNFRQSLVIFRVIMVNENRIIKRIPGKELNGPVVYWMQRDQRINDNWALLYARQIATSIDQPLVVIFCLAETFLGATSRHYGFMMKGLRKVEGSLSLKNIPFKLLVGKQEIVIPDFLKEINAGTLVSDFSPLRVARLWKQDVLKKTDIPYYTVDAHNIVPCTVASNKEEFAAYTIRPKINKLLPEFLEEFPQLYRQKSNPFGTIKNNWELANESLNIDREVKEVDWIKPGEEAAMKQLQIFIREKLSLYDTDRNDPNKKAVSDLSPYLHFGHISAQRIALEVMNTDGNKEARKSFLEELIVRRELADNFCLYNENYDSFEGFRDWAKVTLNAHRQDEREYIYSREEFEAALTHDPLWNAAQSEMAVNGKMHGYMRMYWAKKILEWSRSPEEAFKTAIYLNDKYELDGRDPNGYNGIAWSIGGVHDRAWTERPVYGKIRYMNYNGCKRKFDVQKYISQNE